MATLVDVTNGIKARLATIDKLRVNATEPAQVTPPAAWPFLRQPAATYDQTFDGAMTWFFSIYIILGTASDQYAQSNLMPYLAPTGAKSIKAAIEGAGGTLGGVADYAVVKGVELVGSYEVGGTRYIGAVLICEVATSD